LIYHDWLEQRKGETEIVEFRLVYRGRLPAEGSSQSNPKAKYELRRQFHRQLATLWREHRYLSKALIGGRVQNDSRSEVDRIADSYARCGYRFVPIVNNRWNLGCALDILFLRRDEPGGVVKYGGDIDNRIKVLFDGLRMPQTCNELPESAQAGEDPFYCLLEDDSLITEVNVITDKLLIPLEDSEHIHDVLLIIKARTVVLNDGPFPVARLGW
jgi:hypothetical protein